MRPLHHLSVARRAFLAVGLLGFVSAAFGDRAPPGPLVNEFPVARVSALLRPAATQRITAPTSGRFTLSTKSGAVAPGAVLGRFDDSDLQSTLETARLRLRAARQAEADYIAETPTRRQEALARVADLESRVALAEALAKNPSLLRDLPPAVQTSLAHADPAGLRAQVESAKRIAARLDAPEANETSTDRLQVLEAEHAVKDAETRLRDSVVFAPFAGTFQPALALSGAESPVLLGAGQEIGTLRNLDRIVAAVPALSPYLVRVDLAHTALRLTGAAGREFTAPFLEASTEASPVMGESRVFLYRFSAADSEELARMVQTNVEAQVLFLPSEPIAMVPKLDAALQQPAVFRSGWAAGARQAWPGWTLICEGETALGLAHEKP